MYETAWLRNVQYDQNAFVQAVENIDVEADLNLFIAKAPKKKIDWSGCPYIPWSKSGAAPMPSRHPELDKAATDAIEGLWRGATTMEPLQLQHASVRIAFVHSLHQAPAIVPLASYGALEGACRKCLDHANASLDAYVASAVAVATHRISVEDASGKQRTLAKDLYTHAMWNRVQFWEDALVCTLATEVMQAHFRRIDVELPIFVKVGSFGKLMLKAGIQKPNVVAMIKRVLDRMETMLGSWRPRLEQVLLEGMAAREAEDPPPRPAAAAAPLAPPAPPAPDVPDDAEPGEPTAEPTEAPKEEPKAEPKAEPKEEPKESEAPAADEARAQPDPESAQEPAAPAQRAAHEVFE